MKKSILSLAVIMVITLMTVKTVNAQEEAKTPEAKWEISANYLSGQFSDEYVTEIYDNFGGFNIAASRTLFAKWVGLGVYYKNGSSDGVPYTYGYEDPNAKTDIKINSWGPEVFVKPFKFVKVYARYGFLNVKENLFSQIGDVSVDLDGSSMDYGIRFNIKLVKGLNALLGFEASSAELDDLELDGTLDSWNGNLGLAFSL